MVFLDYDHLFNACRELFGPDIETSADFLHYLQPSGVKSAFRCKAKETHPDRFANKPLHQQDQQAAHFRRVKSAYETLSSFLAQREQEGPRVTARQAPASRRSRPAPPARRYPEEGAHGVPQRPLQLGRYLYYRNVISYRDLLQALSWQRSNRGSSGVIAREWGWMTASDVFAVLSSKLPGKFGEKAVRLGLLDHFKVRMILMEQTIRHQRIGQYFVQSRVLTPQELECFLRELRVHNARCAC